MYDKNKVGARIKELRDKFDLSQEELGFKLGMNKSTIQRYENGNVNKIKDPVIEKMATIFKVSVDYLLGITEEDTGTNEIIPSLDTKEEEILEIFRKLNEEKQNKVIGYAEAQLNDDNIYYIGYNAAMGGERTETRHTKEETKKLIDAFEAEFEKDIPPIE